MEGSKMKQKTCIESFFGFGGHHWVTGPDFPYNKVCSKCGLFKRRENTGYDDFWVQDGIVDDPIKLIEKWKNRQKELDANYEREQEQKRVNSIRSRKWEDA